MDVRSLSPLEDIAEGIPVHPSPCPECGSSRVAWILYGYPAGDLIWFATEIEGGYEIAGRLFTIGGCVLMGDDPEFRCLDCSMGVGS